MNLLCNGFDFFSSFWVMLFLFYQVIYLCQVLTGLLQFVGNDTTYEVRLGGPQSGHQVVKLFLWIQNLLELLILVPTILQIPHFFHT